MLTRWRKPPEQSPCSSLPDDLPELVRNVLHGRATRRRGAQLHAGLDDVEGVACEPIGNLSWRNVSAFVCSITRKGRNAIVLDTYPAACTTREKRPDGQLGAVRGLETAFREFERFWPCSHQSYTTSA